MHLKKRICFVQDFLERQIAIENISSYLGFGASQMHEAEFLGELSEQADCLVLLDLNNIYVNASKQRIDSSLYYKHINPRRIAYYHLAGHDAFSDHLLDSHGQPVCKEVWDLLCQSVSTKKGLGPHPVCIERDQNLPPFDELYKEVKAARRILQKEMKGKKALYRDL